MDSITIEDNIQDEEYLPQKLKSSILNSLCLLFSSGDTTLPPQKYILKYCYDTITFLCLLQSILQKFDEVKYTNFLLLHFSPSLLTQCFWNFNTQLKTINVWIKVLLPSSAPVGNFTWNWAELALLSLFPSTRPDLTRKSIKKALYSKTVFLTIGKLV